MLYNYSNCALSQHMSISIRLIIFQAKKGNILNQQMKISVLPTTFDLKGELKEIQTRVHLLTGWVPDHYDTPVHTYTDTQTQMHACTHTHTHPNKHIYTHTNMHTHTHTHMHAHRLKGKEQERKVHTALFDPLTCRGLKIKALMLGWPGSRGGSLMKWRNSSFWRMSDRTRLASLKPAA